MKNYIYHISFLLLACLGMVSCTEQEIGDIDDAQCIELNVSCVNLSQTRADGDSNSVPATMGGENDLNENLIKTLHCFLYPSNAADVNDVDAVYARKINVADGTQKQAIVRLPMDEETLNNVVFPRPYNDCYVYIIVRFIFF